MSNRVAIYARVSSESQAQDGTITSQIALVREFAVQNSLNIDESAVFVDNGVSGSYLQRPALDALRDRARLVNDIEKILIMCPDRLARKYSHQLILVDEFQRFGVEIIFANRSISKSPEDQLLFQIQGVIAEFEREKIMERSRRGKLFKAKTGHLSVMSGAPYGYEYLPKGSGTEAVYKIDQVQADVIRRIYDMYVEEKLSINKIARNLTDSNIPTPFGLKSWHPSSVGTILRNPTYMGNAAFLQTKVSDVKRKRPSLLCKTHNIHRTSRQKRDKSDLIFIPAPAIIAAPLFNKAAEQAKVNYSKSKRSTKHKYLCRGLLTCEHCKYSYCGSMRPKDKRSMTDLPLGYYICTGKKKQHFADRIRRCNHGMPVRVDVVDDLVWEEVKRLINDPAAVFAEYTNRLSGPNDGRDQFEILIAQKRREIRAKEKEREKLIDLYQSELITKEELTGRLSNIQNAVNQRKNELDSCLGERDKHQSGIELIENLEEFAGKVRKNIDKLKFEDKEKLVNLVIKEIKIDSIAKKITIQKSICLSNSSHLQPTRGR